MYAQEEDSALQLQDVPESRIRGVLCIEKPSLVGEPVVWILEIQPRLPCEGGIDRTVIACKAEAAKSAPAVRLRYLGCPQDWSVCVNS